MATPKRKDNNKSRKTKISISDDSWRSEIENLSLNDERWSCVIGMIVETRLDHAKFLEMFNEAAEEEKRESVFSLSYQKLIRGTKLLGKPNLHHGICQFASKQIEDEGEGAMSPWLICRLIKFFINRAKTRNLEIQQSRARIEKEITKEIETLGNARPNTAAKSKGGSGDAKSFDKVNTRLRKRGEEWRDRIHIDDAPIGGQNLYVVLSGFRDMNLATELLDAGLPLTAIFKVLRPGEELEVDHPQLFTFWSTLETTLKEAKTASRYSQVVFQTFCPPEIDESELETLKTDAYRRISFLMYDLCDIKRQHDCYIKNMKLQSGLEEERPDIQDTEIYDTMMGVFPEESTSVAMIMDALLSQIEGSKPREDTLDQGKTSSETFEKRLERKLDHLNNKFDVFDASEEDVLPGNSDPRLILHGDDFGRNTHHCSLELCPADFGVRVLRQAGISLIWKNVPVLSKEEVEMHEYHIGQISDCFDANIDGSTTEHYLHLLLFDKLINGEIPGSNFLEREDLERKIPFPSLEELRPKLNVERTKSQTISSDKSLTESLPTFFQSDSVIEYRKEIAKTFECPELFSVIDTREMLGSGYLTSTESFPVQAPGILDLKEFDTVQLLSADVFSQVFFTCYQEFNDFKTRYFPPTDSTLILFHNNCAEDEISDREYTASIRTPVCLRDFNRFAICEEKEWLEKEEEKHGRRLAEEAALRKAQTLKDVDDLPLASFYTDADFILPNSIKGTEVRKQKSRQALIDGTETELPAQEKSRSKTAKETNPGKAKIPKRKDKMINPTRKRGESIETNRSFISVKKSASIRSSEDTEPTFLGYDIANHRVQVSGLTSDFLSTDGTVVKVNREEWSYGKHRLQIIVKLLSNRLVVHSVVGDESVMFHLTTTNGILMGFSLSFKRKEERKDSQGSGQSITKRNYQSGKMERESETPKGTWVPEMAVDPEFKVSWPSGLVVETLPGDGPSEPFYIKQSYLSKGPECNGILRETARVFLRDGTIIVFLDDKTVRLMRSNGCIVTCDGFTKVDKRQEKEDGGDSVSASKLKNKHNSKGSIEVKSKRKSPNSLSEDGEISGSDIAVKNSHNLKIHRSIVLEPDGRLYEIFDEKSIQEVGQELVRTASDYEVGEKFTRRSDGTNILINNDGFLAVRFPDDSRITTGYVIEEDLVYCEWTEEEFRRFYQPADNPESESRENILREDGFVSIFLTCCMEHKNYATVNYDHSKIDCNLFMPGDVGVQISSDAGINVTVGSATSLKVKSNEVAFTRRIGTSSSSSVFHLENFSNTSITKNTFLETTDSFGNVFNVNLEGGTSYEKFKGRFDPAEDDEEHSSSSPQLPTAQNNESQPNSRGYRLFVVKRDLSAYEHLHHSDRQTQEDDQTASIFFRQVNEKPDQKLCTTLTTLNPITVSQTWLQPFKVKCIRPRNENRRDLLRSTYSVPWNYLIPYGKNGRGIWDRTWNLPLKSNNDFSGPEVLLARTTQTIQNREENVLKKLQVALGCYWKKAINSFGEYRCFVSRRSSRLEEREIKEWLNDFALGRRKTFDRKLYFDGLFKSRSVKSLEPRISKIRNSGSEDIEDKEEIEWYKTCLRDHIAPRYFDNIPGACFTWVFECVTKINEMRKEHEEEDEEEEKMFNINK